MNNKISLGINIVLLVAVIVLFCLFFSLKKQQVKSPVLVASGKADSTLALTSDNRFKIAYFELDSLENSYGYYKTVRRSLEDRGNQMQGQLNAMRKEFMAKVKDFNEKGPNLSQQQQVAYQQELTQMQNNYSQKEQQLGQQLQDEQHRRLLDVKVRIQNFLKKYAREKGYAFVIAMEENDNFYYKDTARNITGEIVRSLNALEKKK